MKIFFAALSITCFIGTGAFAQMGGMGPGNMGPNFGPGHIGSGRIGGQPVPTTYDSNGQRIYFTGFNDAGQRINFSGGPAWLWMHGGSCADCHGNHEILSHTNPAAPTAVLCRTSLTCAVITTA